jgi:hypothetical protein
LHHTKSQLEQFDQERVAEEGSWPSLWFQTKEYKNSEREAIFDEEAFRRKTMLNMIWSPKANETVFTGICSGDRDGTPPTFYARFFRPQKSATTSCVLLQSYWLWETVTQRMGINRQPIAAQDTVTK